MADSLDPKNLDKRTLARFVRTGVVDEKLLEKHLKSLPDLAEKASAVETKMDDEDGLDDASDAGDE
ncbi:MAG: hypothetical protein ACT4TC_19215 [Myxococcaceae bacterium]